MIDHAQVPLFILWFLDEHFDLDFGANVFLEIHYVLVQFLHLEVALVPGASCRCISSVISLSLH